MQKLSFPPAKDPQVDAPAWQALDAELDTWQAAGKQATFWWRDDDASRPGPQLTRLLTLSQTNGIPIALATIPATARVCFAKMIRDYPLVQVLQHGYAHINHAKSGGVVGAWELGLQRPLESVLTELAKGRDILTGLFGTDRFLPVMVPPWNRIDPSLFDQLPALGFIGLSLCGPRTNAEVAPGLRLVNTHCDPIKWKSTARFTGTAKAIAQLLEHLKARRFGTVDASEPTGILTHHIDSSDAVWDFCEVLLSRLSRHPAAHFLQPEELFQA